MVCIMHGTSMLVSQVLCGVENGSLLMWSGGLVKFGVLSVMHWYNGDCVPGTVWGRKWQLADVEWRLDQVCGAPER